MNDWLLLTTGGRAEHAGNDGYDDVSDSYYSWDNTVANARGPARGDRVAVWSREGLAGLSVIERIDTHDDVKIRRRCPCCRVGTIKRRSRRTHVYRCSRGHEFDQAVESVHPITVFRSYYGPAWVACDALSAGQVRTLSVRQRSQHSIRAMDWDRLEEQLRSQGVEVAVRRIDARADVISEGHRHRTTKVRVGQGAFRRQLLERFGPVCAVSGPVPADALDAAHLYSYALEGRHHDHGGILLRADVHRLFDRGQILIDPSDLRVRVADALKDSDYSRYEGAELHVALSAGHRKWLRWQWEQFLEPDA